MCCTPQHQRHLQHTEASGIPASSKRSPSQPRTTLAKIFFSFLPFSLSFTCWMLLCFAILCLQPTREQPQSDISPGPASVIVLKEQPGLLITNGRTHTQKVYVPPDPRNVYRAHYPSATTQYSWVVAQWTEDLSLVQTVLASAITTPTDSL